MLLRKIAVVFLIVFFTIFNLPTQALAAEQPTAIFHAFNQPYKNVETFVCKLAEQGYSHVQISPAQESNPGKEWYKRYQPFDYSTIKGLGSETGAN
jgi:alpha-amylase